MSSVMHPNGLEPRNTYWLRRVLVGLAALLALLLLWWVLSSLFGSKKDDTGTVTANPQNPQSLAVSDSPSPTPTASGSGSASAAASTSSTPAAKGSASTSPSASVAPVASASPSASASATASPSASQSPAGPTTCVPSALALKLDGDRAPKIGTPTKLTVSYTNTGTVACYLNLAKQPIQVAITSGSDHIWSTTHCAKWQPTGIQELAPGKAQTWSTTWTLQRSAAGCTLKQAKLGAGTYVATASMPGGDSARLVMALHH